MDAETVSGILQLAPLEGEGGRFRRVWSTDHGTAIYFLLSPGDFSAMHRLEGPELWHHYAGAPVRMLLLRSDGTHEEPVLGDDLARDERPLVVVDAGVWMGAETTGAWSLVGATMAPPFRDGGFELARRDALLASHPQAADRIRDLTRTPA